MDTIVIYHGGCRDGFCAAWVTDKYLHQGGRQTGDGIIYHPGYYGQPPPNVIGKEVIIVDFAYDMDTMAKIALECASMLWLDHHKTAIPVADMMNMLITSNNISWRNKLAYEFDLTKSGAGLAWDYFFHGHERPWLVNFVEDRDLWKKNLTNSDIINAYIACLKFDFPTWEQISKVELAIITDRGLTALLKTEQYVEEVCKNVYTRNITVATSIVPEGTVDHKIHKWQEIPIVNICQIDCSEVLHELCKRYTSAPFSLYWFKRHDGMYQYGLRSIGNFDVSVVAKLFGGGGHKNAAGFQLGYLLDDLR